MDLDPEGDLSLFPCLGLLASRLATYEYLRRCYGFSRKGDGLFHSRSLWKLQRELGQFKAQSGFSDIFPSTLRILDEFGTHGKPFTRRIQRRRFQEVWSRTRRGRRIIPELLHPDIFTDIGTFLIGNPRSNRSTLNVGSPPSVSRCLQKYLGWFCGRKASLISGNQGEVILSLIFNL